MVFNFSGFLYEVKVIMVLFLCILATKARSLKEDWIAYICREVLNVRKCYNFSIISIFVVVILDKATVMQKFVQCRSF